MCFSISFFSIIYFDLWFFRSLLVSSSLPLSPHVFFFLLFAFCLLIYHLNLCLYGYLRNLHLPDSWVQFSVSNRLIYFILFDWDQTDNHLSKVYITIFIQRLWLDFLRSHLYDYSYIWSLVFLIVSNSSYNG